MSNRAWRARRAGRGGPRCWQARHERDVILTDARAARRPGTVVSLGLASPVIYDGVAVFTAMSQAAARAAIDLTRLSETMSRVAGAWTKPLSWDDPASDPYGDIQAAYELYRSTPPRPSHLITDP